MSQYLVNDQADLFKSAKELITRFESLDQNTEFELVTVDKKIKPEQIRKAYIRSNFDPELKAQMKGANYVRALHNNKNLRKREAVQE